MKRNKRSGIKRKPRKRNLSACKKAAWDALSKCVRYSHASDGMFAACVTCGEASAWRDLDAGHFIAKNASNAVYFDVRNVHPQCTTCNFFKHGNLAEFYPYMLREYGGGVIEQIKEKRHMHMQWKTGDYEEMEQHYKSEFGRMQKLRAQGVTGRIEIVGWA